MFDFNQQFFEKHQRKLIYLANRWWGRWVLGLNRLPKQIKKEKINKITPNSIHSYVERVGDECTYNGYFFTRPRFAEILAYNLSPFTYLMNHEQTEFQWRFSPVGAMTMILIAIFGGGFAVAGTTTNYYSGAGDGQVFRLTTTPFEDFATIRAGSGTGNNYTGSTQALGRIAASTSSNTWEILVRGVIQADTSGLTSSATISSASLYNYIISYRDNLSAQSLSITSVSTSANTTLTNSDYNIANHGSTKLATDKALSTLTTSAYLETALNASGLANINKTGYSKFSYRMSCDVDNSAPTWSSGNDAVIDAYTSEQTGTSNDPYIEVTYTTTVDYDLVCAVGAYTYTGIAATLNRGYKLACALGEYTYTGIAAGLSRGYGIICALGEYTYTGIAAGFTKALNLTMGVGSYIYTGIAAGFTKALKVALNVGQYVYTGVNATLRFSGWTNKTKNSSSWSNNSKNSSSWTNLT